MQFKGHGASRYTSCYVNQRALTIEGSITVWLASCLTGLDLAKQVKLLFIHHKQSSRIQTNPYNLSLLTINLHIVGNKSYSSYFPSPRTVEYIQVLCLIGILTWVMRLKAHMKPLSYGVPLKYGNSLKRDLNFEISQNYHYQHRVPTPKSLLIKSQNQIIPRTSKNEVEVSLNFSHYWFTVN